MKYLLTPVTMLIWFLLTYSGVYYGTLLMIWMFTLSWVWLLFGYTILIGAISWLVGSLPAFINFLILRFYGINWFSVTIHSVSGLMGLVYIYTFLYQNPIEMSNDSTPILKALWQESWLKTVLLMFPFIGLQLGIIYQAIFAPILMKLEGEDL